MQEHGLLSSPLNPEEMAKFLRENPRLDKKTIGDYIGDKKNSRVLEAFVRYLVFLTYIYFLPYAIKGLISKTTSLKQRN